MSEDENIVRDLAKNLQSTANLMQTLLVGIQDHSTSLAVLKEKINTLKDNVDEISNIVRDNTQTSVVTRLALLEDRLKGMDKEIEQYCQLVDKEIKYLRLNKDKREEFFRKKSVGRLHLLTAAIPGSIALILVIIKLFTGISIDGH